MKNVHNVLSEKASYKIVDAEYTPFCTIQLNENTCRYEKNGRVDIKICKFGLWNEE